MKYKFIEELPDIYAYLKTYYAAKSDRLPHQVDIGSYIIILLEKDSYGIPIISIDNRRYDELVYRGRCIDLENFKTIMALVKEDYDLNSDDKGTLIKNYEVSKTYWR